MPQLPGVGEDVSGLMGGQSAGVPGVGGDVSHLMGGSAPAAAEPPDQSDAATRFFTGLGSMLNPVTMVEGAAHAVAHPIDTVSSLIGAQGDQAKAALEAARLGHYAEALGHGGAALLPLVGPAAAKIGEQIGGGDVAGGLGAGAGLLGGILLPGAIPDTVGLPALAAPAGDAADAVSLADRAGVPLSAATATGSKAVRMLQDLADRSLVGSAVSSGARAAESRGLATLGEQLAAKAAENGGSIAPDAAGDLIQQAIQGKIRGAGRQATDAYDALRQIEQDPANARTVEVAAKAGTPDAAAGYKAPGVPSYRFAPGGAPPDAVFDSVLADARKQGFTGSATQLREAFNGKVASAQDLAESMAEGQDYGGDTALLKDIRSAGGLRPYELDVRQGATAAKMTGEFQPLQQAFAQKWGHLGGGSIFRQSGLGYDDLLDSLHQGGKWADITEPEQLASRLNDMARRGPEAAGGDLEEYLRQTGVEPGSPWWKQTPADNRVSMALPVDLTAAKQALQPVYQELAAEHAITPFIGGSQKGRALVALKTLMDGPDAAPLATVDGALSELKGFSRVKPGAMRTAGQAAAAQAVGQLHDWVNLTAESAPGALDALDAGRAATKAKYAAADALKSTGSTPMQAFSRLTMPGDKQIATLRAVAAQAPDAVPQIGRAWLETALGSAGLEQGASVHGARLAAQWDKLGPATKELLFPDPVHRADLGRFFKLVKMSAETANPSGSGHLVSTLDTLKTALASPVKLAGQSGGYAAISALLHSPTGVKLLTKGLQIPAGNRAAIAAWGAQASAALGSLTSPSGPQGLPVAATR